VVTVQVAKRKDGVAEQLEIAMRQRRRALSTEAPEADNNPTD
jgi:phage replication-related protein YjqB (UPF0714/DUF867 family)